MTAVDSCTFSLERPDLLRARASAQHFDPHLHDTFSLVILTQGSAWLQSQRWTSTVHAGDAFLFNPFEVHAGGDLQGNVQYEVLYPSMRFVSESLGLAARPTELPLFRPQILRRSAPTQALLESLSAPNGAAAKMESALHGVLRACDFEPEGIPEKGMRAVRVACQVIQERYMESIDTGTLAKYARLNKCHFIRIFHRVTGLAPQNYLRQVRVAKARDLICAGLDLVDVAQSAGFCDQAHMTREFKKINGVTPGRLSRDVRSGHRQAH
jgi:AraC-like DNA-binding protein